MSGRRIRSHLWVILSRYYGIDVHLGWAQQARAGYAAQAVELREDETSILDAAIIGWAGDLRDMAVECNLRISRTPVDPSIVESVEVVQSTLHGPDGRQIAETGSGATAAATANASVREGAGPFQRMGPQPYDNRDPRQQPNTSEAPGPPPDVPPDGLHPQVWRSPILSETDFASYLRGLLYNPAGHEPPTHTAGSELISTVPQLPAGQYYYYNSGLSIDPPQLQSPIGQHSHYPMLLHAGHESAMEPHKSQRNFQVNIARVSQIQPPEPPSTTPLIDLTIDNAPAAAPQAEIAESHPLARTREVQEDNVPIPPVDTIEPPTAAPSTETQPDSPERTAPASGSVDRRPDGEFKSLGDPVIGPPKASYAQESAVRSTVDRLADVKLPPRGTFPPWEPPQQSRAPPQIPTPVSQVSTAMPPPQLSVPPPQAATATPASQSLALPQQGTVPTQNPMPPPPVPVSRPLPASDPALPGPGPSTRPHDFPRLDSSATKPPQETIRPGSYRDPATEKLQDLANAAEIDWVVNEAVPGYSVPPTPGLEGPGVRGLQSQSRNEAEGSERREEAER
ncbi:hypothetical protein B0A48_02647 [Cryoendolithus antarcticus]|uniref:Uncharacterized protein n=1 Tax=Cryoendolithus antarcticus TaxID=1507870 RepID=A0A1V8TL95_9PEZI|nr:hypothetical protein B0A48_02647 [Cryoendolithus antarcticus]